MGNPTAVGSISGWSATLLCAVNMMLECQFPMLLMWGPEMIVLYNDACMPLEGERHPDALGRTGQYCWPEAWHILAPKPEFSSRTGGETLLQEPAHSHLAAGIPYGLLLDIQL